MKRRDVIKLGAVAVGASVAPSCALPRKLSTLDGYEGAQAFNAMLDNELGQLDQPGLLQRLVEKRTNQKLSPEKHEKIAAHDALFRRMLATVLVTQGFRELPLSVQVEPSVQDRMWKHADLISTMVFDVSDMLAKTDQATRMELQKRLRDDPELPMTLGEALDERAGRAGLSRTRRGQLRGMMKEATFRLKTQHPSAIIDEHVAKVERLRPTTTADGRTITLAEKLGERQFWQYQRMQLNDPGAAGATTGAGSGAGSATAGAGSGAGSGSAGAGAGSGSAAATPALLLQLLENARAAAARDDCRAVVSLGRNIHDLDRDFFSMNFATDAKLADCVHRVAAEDRARARALHPTHQSEPEPQPDPEPATPKHHPGETGLRAGGYMLGIGLVVGIISGLLVNAAFGFIIGVTLGVLLVGVGLLTLLISAIIYAAND